MENADAFVGALARRLDELPVVELPSRLNEIFERRDAATLEGALAAGISERQLAAYRTALAEEMRHRFDTIPSTIDPLEVAGISSEQNRQWRENVGEILAPFTGRVLTIDYGVPGIVAKAADEAGIPLAEIDGRLPTKTSYEMGTDRAVKFQRSVPPILLMDGTAADRYDLGTETPNR
jgi:hypothetical protein